MPTDRCHAPVLPVLARSLTLGVLGVRVAVAGGQGEAYDLDAVPTAAPGFEVALFAREPILSHPSALCFDRRGRLFVGHGPQFRAPTPETPGDSIVVLSDRDGDGRAELVSTFARGLNCVQGLAFKGDELWVANSPELTILRDLDGDDVADEYEVVFAGLSHLRHGLHGLTWAPDGRLYMTQGDSRVQPHAPRAFRVLQRVRPELADEPRPRRRFAPDEYRHGFIAQWPSSEGGVLRCAADGSDLELVARGLRNPFDLAFDDDFEWLTADNDAGPERDRFVAPFPGAHFGWAHPWSPGWDEPSNPATAPTSGSFPALNAATAGLAYAGGSAFPAELQDAYFVADWLGSAVLGLRRRWSGALATIDAPFPVLAAASTDGGALFRPTDLAFGPDGALYVLGWGSSYGSRAAPFGALDAEAELNEGRVFRIAWRAAHPLPESADVASAELALDELYARLSAPVAAVRVQAQDELVRRGSAVVWDLARTLEADRLDRGARTWATWALARIALADRSLDAWLARRASERRPVGERLQAVQALGFRTARRAGHEPLPPIVDALLADPEPRVRLAAVTAVRAAADRTRLELLAGALERETDRTVRHALERALAALAGERDLLARLGDWRGAVRNAALLALLEDGRAGLDDVLAARDDDDPRVARTAERWLEWRNRRNGVALEVRPAGGDYHEPLTVRFDGAAPPRVVRYTLDGTVPGSSSPAYDEPLVLAGESVALMAAVFEDERRISAAVPASFRWVPADEWAAREPFGGLESFGDDAYELVVDGCAAGAAVYVDAPADGGDELRDVPSALAGATLLRTARADLRRSARRLAVVEVHRPTDVWVALDERVRRVPGWLERAGFVASDERIATARQVYRLFHAAVEPGRLVLGPNARQGVMYFAVLRPRADVGRPARSSDVLVRLPDADPARGAAHFFGPAACFACHRVGERGADVGPDLTDLGRRARPAEVVRSILEPSATIIEGYQQARLVLDDGSELVGMLRGEERDRWTVVTADGRTHVVRPSAVAGRELRARSPMPDNYGELLSADELADLVAWLVGPRPVPAAGTSDSSSSR